MTIRSMIILPACGLLCFCLLLSWSTVGFAAVRIIGEVVTGAPPKPILVVYAEGNETSYSSATGWMGNTNAISCETNCTVHPHSGNACIKIQYKTNDKWGGMVWLDPANEGHDLSDATKLTWWARGETGGELVNFFYGGYTANRPYKNTAEGKVAVVLTKKWKRYSFDLTGQDLSQIKTGFGWSIDQGKVITFYLDDIQYEE